MNVAHSSPWSNLTHLIMVAGHMVLKQDTDALLHSDKNKWYLFDYQSQQFDTFYGHIKTGVELAATDEKSMLMFSGANQHIKAGPMTEGLSAWMAASAENWFGHASSSVPFRSTSEEFATDRLVYISLLVLIN